MTVRAKFYVKEIKQIYTGSTDENEAAEIIMDPVFGSYPGSKEGDNNESWSKWTPSGSLHMTVTNPSAIAQFELGKAYFLDFTPVE